jgi:hypothetical protein
VSNILELRDLSIAYGSTPVLNSMNLTVVGWPTESRY